MSYAIKFGAKPATRGGQRARGVEDLAQYEATVWETPP
jgi:hypothetical protein